MSCLSRALRKIRHTPSQTLLPAKERQRNLRGAFEARREEVEGGRFLLLDDVFTTGATLNEGAKALLRAGAKEVYALTLARSVG